MAKIKTLPGAILAAALALAPQTALAGGNDKTKGVYAGIGVVSADVGLCDNFVSTFVSGTCDIRRPGPFVYGGYMFNENFGLEGGLGFVRGFKATGTVAGGGSATITADYSTLYLGGVGRLPLGNFGLFAKAGVHRYSLDAELVAGSTRAKSEESKVKPFFGAGAEYNFGNFGTRLEYKKFKGEDSDADTVALSILYRFQ